MSETIASVEEYLRRHKRDRAELRRKVLEVEELIETCEKWIVELREKEKKAKP